MKISLDKNGYLLPYTIKEIDIENLERHFVKNFPQSKTRQILFNNYLEYINDFKTQFTAQFTQWIDGSFISKKQNPNDIDFVTFIDTTIFQKNEQKLEKFWSFSLESKGLDAYLVEVYPENENQFESITQTYRTIWKNRFGRDKSGLQKGFIEINFQL